MRSYQEHLIQSGAPIKEALARLNFLAEDAILFIVNEKGVLLGSLTDGDVRRGLINDLSIDAFVEAFIQDDPHFILKTDYTIEQIIAYRNKNYKVIPVVDAEHVVCNVINFRLQKSYLPVDAMIMAGGRGERLRPHTDTIPKPLLRVGDKPILEHNIERLLSFGVDDFWLSIRYLGDQIENYFQDGKSRNSKIEYVREIEPLGTIGAISKISEFRHDYILLTNSDLLTNLDYEEFFNFFISTNSDMSVVTIPYYVDIPYAVLEANDKNEILSFTEKPTYTYYSNGGIYLIKKSVLNIVPKASFYNATDLMEELIVRNMKITSFPFVGYWLDIGKPEDFKKANDDIHKIKF